MTQVVVVDTNELIQVSETPTVVVAQEAGPPAAIAIVAAGPQGPPGPPGPSGGTYSFPQPTPAAMWDIQHNLNTFAALTVVDETDHEVECDVEYVDANRIVVRFVTPVAGKALLG